MSDRSRLREWVGSASKRIRRPHAKPVSESEPVRYPVGNLSILLPPYHDLPVYQNIWRLYDKPLQYLCEALSHCTDNLRAIDIGANVGDTAAALNVAATVPVLCIEGDPVFLPFLRQNAQALGPHIAVEECFVGQSAGHADGAGLDRRRGTTSAVDALAANTGDLPVCRLESILERHPDFREAQLIKIDTDGADFKILLSHFEFISHHTPILFFEYVVDSQPSYDESLRCMEGLVEIGYEQFLVFDNFGNLLLSTDSLAMVRQLNHYLLSHRMFGTAVHYFDICAVTARYRHAAQLLQEKVTGLAFERLAA
jgi:FkbM family methyltransferase